MSLSPANISRTPNSVCFDKIQELRQVHGDLLTASLLGIKVYALGFRDQKVPSVRRLAYLFHRMTFHPSDPVSLFDILTCGKYDRTPQEPTPRPTRENAANQTILPESAKTAGQIEPSHKAIGIIE